MAFGEYMQTQQMMGSDEGDITKTATESSEGVIVIETLLNIRTVASLSMEDERVVAYQKTLADKNSKSTLPRNTISGTGQGLGSFFQMVSQSQDGFFFLLFFAIELFDWC